MSRPAPLTQDELQKALQDLLGWEIREDALCRAYDFEDFTRAFAFMTSCALVAERMNHHPDWDNVYNRVNVRLRTHDVGAITILDVRLAHACEARALALGGVDPDSAPLGDDRP